MDPAPELAPRLREWLVQEVGEVIAVESLIGGLTAQMLHLRRVDGGADIVVRRWSGDDPYETERVRTEAAGLTALAETDLPVPRLIAADPDGAASGRPTTVTTFLDGAVDLTPTDPRDWVRRQAEMLVDIHRTAVPDLGRCDVWSRDDGAPWLADADLADAAITLAGRPPDPRLQVFAHGDYQHFNLLWQRGRLSAVVDWPSVGLADRGVDVGHCRLNLAVLYSAELAMQFLDDYEELAGVVVDPATDVQQLLCFGKEWPEFIPHQVADRRPVDGAGMAARVRETVVRTLRRAG